MFGFTKKEPEKRADDVDYKRLQIRMTKLESEMLDIAVTLDTLRNKVLRKIQTKKDKGEEETDILDDSGFLKTN